MEIQVLYFVSVDIAKELGESFLPLHLLRVEQASVTNFFVLLNHRFLNHSFPSPWVWRELFYIFYIMSRVSTYTT